MYGKRRKEKEKRGKERKEKKRKEKERREVAVWGGAGQGVVK